jgi:hypothetical protein
VHLEIREIPAIPETMAPVEMVAPEEAPETPETPEMPVMMALEAAGAVAALRWRKTFPATALRGAPAVLAAHHLQYSLHPMTLRALLALPEVLVALETPALAVTLGALAIRVPLEQTEIPAIRGRFRHLRVQTGQEQF